MFSELPTTTAKQRYGIHPDDFAAPGHLLSLAAAQQLMSERWMWNPKARLRDLGVGGDPQLAVFTLRIDDVAEQDSMEIAATVRAIRLPHELRRCGLGRRKLRAALLFHAAGVRAQQLRTGPMIGLDVIPAVCRTYIRSWDLNFAAATSHCVRSTTTSSKS